MAHLLTKHSPVKQPLLNRSWNARAKSEPPMLCTAARMERKAETKILTRGLRGTEHLLWNEVNGEIIQPNNSTFSQYFHMKTPTPSHLCYNETGQCRHLSGAMFCSRYTYVTNHPSTCFANELYCSTVRKNGCLSPESILYSLLVSDTDTVYTFNYWDGTSQNRYMSHGNSQPSVLLVVTHLFGV